MWQGISDDVSRLNISWQRSSQLEHTHELPHSMLASSSHVQQ